MKRKDRKFENEQDGIEASMLSYTAPAASTEWKPARSMVQAGARETGVKVGAHQPGQGLR